MSDFHRPSFLKKLDLVAEQVQHLMELVEKHLQGQHDQADHAGGRGGAATEGTEQERTTPPDESMGKVFSAQEAPKFSDATPEDLLKGVETLEPHLRSYVSSYTADEYKAMGAKIRVSSDGKSGYALKPDGEFISVFSSVKGRGDFLVKDAIHNGADHLDCFDGMLPILYGNNGFKETGRLKWDDQYAPKGWDYEKYGRPDVIFMSRNPNKKGWRTAWQK
jgi:hypothetical protein